MRGVFGIDWRGVAAFLLLAACSDGGGGGAPPAVNVAPTVNAGPDQTVDEAALVRLSATVSDPDSSPTLAWTQVSGPTALLTSTTSLAPFFVAPFIGTDTVLTYRLTANDGVNPPVSDDVSVTVRDTGGGPFFVDAQATDPAISTGPSHLVVPPTGAGPGTGKLLVFLPGTGGAPVNYSLFLQRAASRGYHTIGLSYENAATVAELCLAFAPADPDCTKKVRNEIVTGTDTTGAVTVSRADSIENRLEKLLAFLQTNDTTGGWGPYRSGGLLVWNLIGIAGHSQGAGHAAFISQRQTVVRALLFSGTEAANWTSEPSVTPFQRLYGFAHQSEPNVSAMFQSWANLNMVGPLTNVDAGPPPPFGPRRLVTARLECNGLSTPIAFHGCVVANSVTPVAAFGPVWDYMLGVGE